MQDDGSKTAIALHGAWLDHWKWKEKGDSIAGIRSLTMFAQLGYSAPPDLMEWIVSNFENYLISDSSLDKVFNVSQQTKRKERIDKRNAGYVIEIKMLVHSFNITTDEAKNCLHRRLEESGVYIADTSLSDIYDRDGSKVTDKRGLSEIMKENIGDFYSNSAIDSLVAMYPEEIRAFLQKRRK